LHLPWAALAVAIGAGPLSLDQLVDRMFANRRIKPARNETRL
jgi:hypothetical protein